MAIQKFNIRELTGEPKKSPLSDNGKKSTKKDSGSILGGLAQTGLAALPLVPKKYIAIGVGVIFIILYGTVSLIMDVVNLF